MRTLLRTVRLLLAALGAVVLLVTCTPLVSWVAARMTGGNWTGERRGTMIVLHGAGIDEEFVGHNAYLRAMYAARYFREGKFDRVIVSGAGAGPIRRFLMVYGVPAETIVMESASTSTHENALFTARLLAGVTGPKVLVTSDYHMSRARGAFAKAGQEVLPLPVPDVLKRVRYWDGRWSAFIDLAFETCKTAYYSLRGWA